MTTKCQHCNVDMLAWQPPPEAVWDSPFLYICFNDDCPYFQRSMTWMKDHYAVSAMYRFRVDPASGGSGPIPVWSRDALRDGIVPSGQLPNAKEDP